jgi:hypothetical protein
MTFDFQRLAFAFQQGNPVRMAKLHGRQITAWAAMSCVPSYPYEANYQDCAHADNRT